uniref:5'-Nucleotidase n=1 Tax=Rhipicephalus zambeziensis TaxID=60191 RepID=A0A224YBS3_9ACAR
MALIAMKEIRGNVTNSLFVNAGDFFQGTPYYTLFKSRVISDVMSQMGYDYACLGNHEFDDGPANLAPFLQKMNESNVTVVGTNTNFSQDPDLRPYDLVKSAIRVIGDMKIGILGAVIPTTKYGSNPGPNVEFYDEKVSFRNEVDYLVSQNVNIIIAITHSGFEREVGIVENITEIDILVGGHTNTFLYTGKDHAKEDTPEGPYPYVVNRTDGSRALVVQDFRFGKYLGRLDVTFNSTGHVVGWGGNPILLNASVKEDEYMKCVLQPFKENLTERMKQVVGSTRVIMEHKDDICRMRECNLGNLIADAYFEYYLDEENTTSGPYWSELNGALVTAGSIRTGLPSFYNVTWGDVVTTLPYGNSLVTVTLSGTDIWNMFENSVTMYNTTREMQKGRFLQVSGFRVQYNLTTEQNRVTSVSVLCANCSVPIYEPLNYAATYKIVTSDYVAKGGDGYKFSNTVIISDVGPIEYEALEKYIVKMSPIWTPDEGRIKITWNKTDEEAVINYTKSIRDNQICEKGACDAKQ